MESYAMNRFLLLISLLFFPLHAGCTPDKKPTPDTTPANDPDLAALSGQDDFKQLFMQKKYDEALKRARSGLAKSPKNPKLHYFAGFAAFNLGRHEEALAAFKAALKNGGNFADLYVNTSETLFFLKRYDECVTIIKTGLKRFPKAPGLYYNMGGILVEKKEFEAAARWFNDALLRSPRFPPALISLGALYFNMKKLDLAKRQFKTLATVKGYEVQGLLKLAYIELSQKNYDGALVLLEKAKTLDSTDPTLKKFLRFTLIKRTLKELGRLLGGKKCKAVKDKLRDFAANFPDYKEMAKLKSAIAKHCPAKK